MSSQVVCRRCSQSFEIDDGASFTKICSHCGEAWTEDEPQIESEIASAVDSVDSVDSVEEIEEVEYEFEAAAHDITASDPLAANEAESNETESIHSDQIDSSDTEENQAEVSIENDESEVGEATHDWQRIATKPRPKRQEASLVSKIVPPILGGLSAVPISIAILWYGFGRDLGNAGPTVAKYVPWVVPEVLRGPQPRRYKTYQDNDPNMRGNRDFGVLGGRSKDFPNLSLPKTQARTGDPQTSVESMIAGDPSEEEKTAESSSLPDTPSDGSTELAEGESRGRMPLEDYPAGEMASEPSPSEEMTDEPAMDMMEFPMEKSSDMESADVKPLDLSLLDSILKDASSDADIMQRSDTMVQSIGSTRDRWASEPGQSRDHFEWDVYRETLRLAEMWMEQTSTPNTDVDLPVSFRTLLETQWYREWLWGAASGRFAELYPPELFETVVWPVHSIASDSNDASGLNCFVTPHWQIGSQVVRWRIANDAVAQRIREISEQPDRDYSLVIGSVEQVDELGIVVRVESVIP